MARTFMVVLLSLLISMPSLGQLVQAPASSPTGILVATRLQAASSSIVSLGTGDIEAAWRPLASASPHPPATSAETVLELLMELDDDTPVDLSWTINSSNGTSIATDPSSLARRDTVNAIDRVRMQRSLWVFFNSTDHGGYNLTIPFCLSPNLVLGNGEFPNGTYVTNATLGDIMHGLSLPPEKLYNYTLTMAQRISDKINTTLAEVICEGPAGATRQLLFNAFPRPNYRNADASEGFMSAFLVGVVGVTGIAWGGTHLAIAHKWPTANITIESEIAILAATTAVEFIFCTILWRLQSVPKRWIGRTEARILNAFIFLGEQLLKGLQKIQSSTCFSTATAQTGLSGLLRRARNQVQIFRFGYGTNTGSMSAANLVEVGRDVEMGNNGNDVVAETMEEITQAVVDLVVQRQIEGGGQPGQRC